MNQTTDHTLHTLNVAAREQHDLLARLLRCATPGDSLLLIEDGVYNLADSTALAAIDAGELTLYALQTDLAARGLQQLAAEAGATVVDDSGFVTLACSHGKVVSWCR